MKGLAGEQFGELGRVGDKVCGAICQQPVVSVGVQAITSALSRHL